MQHTNLLKQTAVLVRILHIQRGRQTSKQTQHHHPQKKTDELPVRWRGRSLLRALSHCFSCKVRVHCDKWAGLRAADFFSSSSVIHIHHKDSFYNLHFLINSVAGWRSFLFLNDTTHQRGKPEGGAQCHHLSHGTKTLIRHKRQQRTFSSLCTSDSSRRLRSLRCRWSFLWDIFRMMKYGVPLCFLLLKSHRELSVFRIHPHQYAASHGPALVLSHWSHICGVKVGWFQSPALRC